MIKVLLNQGLELSRALIQLPLQIVPALLQVRQGGFPHVDISTWSLQACAIAYGRHLSWACRG